MSLQQGEEGLRITLQSMGDGVISTDCQGIVTMLNPSAEELTGWSQANALGRPFADVFRIHNSITGEPGDDIVGTVLRSGQKVNLANHTVLVSADGVHRHISDSAAPIRGRDGALLGVVVIFSDVSERYRLTQELRMQAARSAMAISLANLGAWEYDYQTKILTWSTEYRQIVGVDEDMQPTPDFWITLVHPEDLAQAVEARDQAIRAGSEASTMYQQRYRIYRKKDGALRHVVTYGSVERDERGRILKILGSLQDVTEQVETQQLISESERLYRLSFEQSALGLCHISLEGRYLRVNKKLCDIVGYSEQELLSLSVYQTIFVDDHELIRKTMDWLIENHGMTQAVERRFVRKDGALLWLALSSSVMTNTDGEALYLITSVQDITARKAAESALRQSEQRLRRAQEISQTGNWEITLSTGEMWASEQAFRIYGFGLTPEHILPLSVPQNAVMPKDRSMMDLALRRLISGEAPYDVEFSIHRINDGVPRTLHSQAVLERDEQGNPARVVGVLQDITEHRQAEEEYGQALKTTLDGFWLLNEDGCIIRVNNSICQMLRYAPDELIGEPITKIHMLSYSNELEHIRDRVFTVGADRFESRLRRKDGDILDVEMSVSLLRDTHNVCAFIRDITDRKRKEEHIQYLSYHDMLTGLYNRTYFEEASSRLSNTRQLPVSIIMGDIDGLKLTNDVFGQARGDELLLTIAGILRRCARGEDIVTRIGGDEFCILLPRASENIAHFICERIQSACEQTVILLGEHAVHPSLSTGHATRLTADQSLASVYKAAEDAMYRRKLLVRKSMHSSLIASIRTTMYEKSHETHEHAERLASLAKALGQAMGLDDEQLADLELLSALHDLGKIGVDERILGKAGPLTEEEWLQMRKHPEIGYRIALASPELSGVADGILCHHERWDGKGYPQGLQGENIPLLARILTIVDCYDAMTNDRVYHAAVSHEEAISEITKCSGTQFDPEITGKFLQLFQVSAAAG